MFEIRPVSGCADPECADPHRFDGNGDGVGCES
jgi:hypothetical protein